MGRYVSSIKSVANVMNVTEYTVKTWIKRNKLKSIVSKNEGRIITKKELFRFLRPKNYIYYAQVRHGYVPKNHWEYFIEKDFFNQIKWVEAL